jgi:hypothetical protein
LSRNSLNSDQFHQLAVAVDHIVFNVFRINLAIDLIKEFPGAFDFGFSISLSSVDDMVPFVSAMK